MKNKPGFKLFQQKLNRQTEGNPINEAIIFAKETLGSRVYERYAGLFELLSGERDFGSFIQWYKCQPYKERQVLYSTGRRYYDSALGMLKSHELAIREAVKYLKGYLDSQRQDGLSEDYAGLFSEYSAEEYLRIRPLREWSPRIATPAPRSREESFRRLYSGRTWFYDIE